MKKNIIMLYLLIIIEFIILFNSKIVIDSVKTSIIIFEFNIFPSLFPTMITGGLLVKLNIEKIIPSFIKKIFNKLFNFDDVKLSIFILSFICGSPTSSIIITNYYNKGLITEDECMYMSFITQFINPLFILSIGINLFNSTAIGFLLLILLLLNNLIKAFILKNKFNTKRQITYENKAFLNEFITTIKDSINSSLLIFALVITFSLLTTLITNIFNLNQILDLIINSILEVTSSINKLNLLNISKPFKILIAYLILNFGGICIHMQTLFLNPNKKIRYIKYLTFRG